MNRHLTARTYWEPGDAVLFKGSGRGSKKTLRGIVRAVVSPYAGINCSYFQEMLDEYPPSRLAFDPSIVGRNGQSRHYLVDVCGTLYRPNLAAMRFVASN